MAGFAIFMEFAALTLLGVFVASAFSTFLYNRAKKHVRRFGLTWHPYMRESAAAPFAALAWIYVALFIHVWISNTLAHQDCGFSPDPYVTLPNGYVLGSLNTYDGYIVAPGSHTEVPYTGPGYVRGLVDIQWTPPYFRGSFRDSASVLRSFTLDTRNASIQVSAPNGNLSFEDAQTSVHIDAHSYWNLYDQNRHKWPSAVFVLLIMLGEGAILWWTLRLKASLTPLSPSSTG
jgi:hypothetical protein